MEGSVYTTATTSTRVVRPFKNVALILIVICVIVVIAVLANKNWITATGFNQGLWQECYNGSRIISSTPSPIISPTYSPVVCSAVPVLPWLIACQALVVLVLLLTIVACGFFFVAYSAKRYANFYKLAGVVLFISAVFMIVTLAVFPIMSIREPVVIGRQNWELAWGYGLGWGALILMLVVGILLLFAPDKQEIYYSDK